MNVLNNDMVEYMSMFSIYPVLYFIFLYVNLLNCLVFLKMAKTLPVIMLFYVVGPTVRYFTCCSMYKRFCYLYSRLFLRISDGQINTDQSGTSNAASALRDSVRTNTIGEYYNAGQAASNGH